MSMLFITCLMIYAAVAQKTTRSSQTGQLCNGAETKSGPCFFEVTYRDFQATRMQNTDEAPNVREKYIPDFEAVYIGGNAHRAVNGLLKPFLNRNHKPELSNEHSQMTSADTFAAWYDECAGPPGPGLTCGPSRKKCGINRKTGIPCGYSYRFDSLLQVHYDAVSKKYSLKNNNHFLPLSNKRCPEPLVNGRCGWGDQPAIYKENYAFTTEMNLLFKYKGGESFQFTGDDDFWVFIGSRLAVDIGGLHPPLCKTLQLPKAGCQSCEGVVTFCDDGAVDYKFDASYLKVGKTYRFDLFHAERHSTGSNFNFETTLDLKADSCKDFLAQLKAGQYTSPELDPGLLVTEENCPGKTFEFEEFKDSSFCDIRKCKPGYEPVGNNYQRLVCDGDKLRSYGKAFKCRKITSTTKSSSDNGNSTPDRITPSKTTTKKDATIATTTSSPATTSTVSSKASMSVSSTTGKKAVGTSTISPTTLAPSSTAQQQTTSSSSVTESGTKKTSTNIITKSPTNVPNSGALLTPSAAAVAALFATITLMI